MEIRFVHLTRLGAATLTATLMLSVLQAPPAHASNHATPVAETTIVTDGETWSIQLPDSSDEDPTVAYPVSYCSGTFTGPRRINSTLEWGGQQTCEDPQNRPHWIFVRLESTCDGILCVIFTQHDRLRSPFSQDLTRVATVQAGEGCDNTNRRKFRLVAEIYARGAHQGNVFSDEITIACSV
ncbi:hypothetical protein OG792_04815 [Micromonospora sp. NBC_01699]|uniref:hypothetical protein n=1 Tax=Micromonospora sp. NBC_01699 TaxID=2975984 RepID=UPI002E2F0379|nr:hypothetical protein [Micromonospora sp. NBC_01699]